MVPLGGTHDGNRRMLKSIRDVTEEKKIKEKLKVLATIDSLSGLNNRAEFMNLAKEEFERVRRNKEQLSLLIMDLDYFKLINDSFGHAAGDEVIGEVGRLIKTSFRKTDSAGRIGGEEFAVVLKNTSLEDAQRIAEKFRQTVANRKVVYEGQEITFTISIGLAGVFGNSDDIKDIGDILKRADGALYKAKANGRNRVETYSPSREVDF